MEPAIEITVAESNELLQSGTPPRLIDCREPDEFAICRIEGAELIPLSTFAKEAPDKLGDTGQRILVYCHHGMRSLRATQFLRKLGYRNAQSIAGGIDMWSQEIDPAVPRY